MQTTVDGAGRPLRKYELLIPAAGDAFRGGVPLATSLAEPVVYAQVERQRRRRPAPLAGRAEVGRGALRQPAGNEGSVGSMATIFRIRRSPSAQARRATAGYGKGVRNARRLPQQVVLHLPLGAACACPHPRLPAVDDAVFQEDWRHRPAPAMVPGDLSQFPAGEARWDALKRQQVSGELDQLNAFPHTAAGKAQALERYRALSNDALRVLAGLADNDRAFTQITTYTLDPDDAANADRRGPDSAASYVPNPG